jgi:hypothetical protein
MSHHDTFRTKIIHDFALWAALSATRSGCPIKSRDLIYSMLGKVNFRSLLSSQKRISKKEFDKWHKAASLQVMELSTGKMCAGWATKIINVYLKASVYIGGLGRPGFYMVIHPPVDNGLWNGLRKRYISNRVISPKVFYRNKIKDIVTYEDYMEIIGGLELVAREEKCTIIEVDHHWTLTKHSH